ncbi:MAG: hypothetical protein [Bacteriophage sp.]|nr:MAG: hypothetical protein [Bacteriophage sp.]
MATAKKTSVTKKPTGGNTSKAKVAEVKHKEVEAPTRMKAFKEPEPTDLIMCRSVFPGRWYFVTPRTENILPFETKDAINYVEYQDLRQAMLSRSDDIMKPALVIEDEELLELPIWKPVKELYEKLYAVEDPTGILDLPYKQFKEAFTALPIGMKKSVSVTVASMVNEGTFDSMNKVKAIDEACGTNIALLLG